MSNNAAVPPPPQQQQRGENEKEKEKEAQQQQPPQKSPTPEEEFARFQNSVQKAKDKPIRLFDGIRYNIKTLDENAPRTKVDFLDQYFEKAVNAKTFGELIEELQGAVVSLRGVGIYKQIKVHVGDLNHPVLSQHLRDYCMVYVDIVEKKTYTGSIGGYMTEDGPEVQLEGAFRNLWGRGETAFGRLSTSADTVKSLTFTLGLSKPVQIRALNRSAVLHVLTHNSIFDNSLTSNFTQRVAGGNIRLDMLPHSISYDGAWRNTSLGTDPSPQLQRDAGTSIKSSIRYTFTKDFRDNVTFPSSGHAYQLSTELAGLGGDVKYVRNEAAFNYNFPIFRSGIAFNYILKGGLLTPLQGDHTRICDRFFLGGVGTTLSMRGFKSKGIDTGNSREAHGGDMYYTTAAHLTFPIPFLSHFNFIRAHVFANAGNLVLVKNYQFKEATEELKARARSAVGAGIIFTTPLGGRFEFNFCYPIRAYVGDKVAKGFQFGVAFTV